MFVTNISSLRDFRKYLEYLKCLKYLKLKNVGNNLIFFLAESFLLETWSVGRKKCGPGRGFAVLEAYFFLDFLVLFYQEKRTKKNMKVLKVLQVP